jgi:hypothetical protein
MWHTIHFVALGYPSNPTPQQRESYRTFFTTLGDVLPCKMCSQHFAQHLRELPVEPYLESGDRLFEWTVKLHNIVNASTGAKKQWTVDEARASYVRMLENGGGSPSSSTTNALWIIIAFLAVVVVALIVMSRFSGA